MRIAKNVEEFHGSAKAGSGSTIKNQSSWGRTTGVVTRSGPSRYNPGQAGATECVGSVRKEGNMGSGMAKAGIDNKGRNTRNLPY